MQCRAPWSIVWRPLPDFVDVWKFSGCSTTARQCPAQPSWAMQQSTLGYQFSLEALNPKPKTRKLQLAYFGHPSASVILQGPLKFWFRCFTCAVPSVLPKAATAQPEHPNLALALGICTMFPISFNSTITSTIPYRVPSYTHRIRHPPSPKNLFGWLSPLH